MRENYPVRDSRSSVNVVEFDVERTHDSSITVRVHREKVIELLSGVADQYTFLLDRLDSSMLLNSDSSEVELGTIDGCVGFYGHFAQYGVSLGNEASGGFRWSAHKPN